MKRTPDIEEQLRQRLGQAEVMPPEGLWEAIERQLPPETARTTATTRRIRLRRWSIAAAFIMFASIGGGLLWHQEKDTQQSVLTADITPKDGIVSVDTADGATVAVPTTTSYSRPSNAALLSTAETNREAFDGRQETQEPKAITTEMPDKYQEAEKQNAEEQETEKQKTEKRERKKQEKEKNSEPMPLIHYPTRSLPHRVSVGLYASNNLSEQQNLLNEVRMSNVMAAKFIPYGEEFNNGKAPVIYLYDITEEEHHAQPLSFGLTASYALSNRWAVTTGLVYTQQQSDFIKHIGNIDENSRQTLRYIGIPIEASYRLCSIGNLHAYTSAGLQADCNVKATIKANGIKNDIDRDRLQLSTMAAIGLQYDVTSQLSIYAEPTARYYFDNNSAVSNYFKEHPFTFNLQVGLRWNINK